MAIWLPEAARRTRPERSKHREVDSLIPSRSRAPSIRGPARQSPWICAGTSSTCSSAFLRLYCGTALMSRDVGAPAALCCRTRRQRESRQLGSPYTRSVPRTSSLIAPRSAPGSAPRPRIGGHGQQPGGATRLTAPWPCPLSRCYVTPGFSRVSPVSTYRHLRSLTGKSRISRACKRMPTKADFHGKRRPRARPGRSERPSVTAMDIRKQKQGSGERYLPKCWKSYKTVSSWGPDSTQSAPGPVVP